MPLINCKISLDITWPQNCVISSAYWENKIFNNKYKLYVPLLTLSKEDDIKTLKKL